MEWVAALAVIAAVVVVWWGWVALLRWFHTKRIARLTAVASGLGFRFAEHDHLDCLELPFLLRDRDGRGIDWTMWGKTSTGENVRVVEYWYYDKSTDANGNRRRTYHRFTSVLTNVGGGWPHMAIAPEGVFRIVRDALGFRDIQFESEEVNRRFRVNCDDRRFASTFVDPRMMQFLLDTAGKTRFEVAGAWTLCAVSRLDPERVPDVATDNERFQGQMSTRNCTGATT